LHPHPTAVILVPLIRAISGLVLFRVDGVDQTHISVEWPDDEPAVEVLEESMDGLHRPGNAPLAQAFSPEALFENLARALSEATRIRTYSSGSGFTRSTSEWLAEGWLVTGKELFSIDHGLVIEQGSIKFPVPMMRPREIGASKPPSSGLRHPTGLIHRLGNSQLAGPSTTYFGREENPTWA